MKKKIIIVSIVSLLVISIIGVMYVQAINTVTSADLNGDGIANNADVQMILNDPKLADVNNDGKIDNDDIEIIIDNIKLGDVNLDGHICAEDSRLVLNYYAEISSGKSGEFNGLQKLLADVSCDGFVNSSDASDILAYISDTNTGLSTNNYDSNNDGFVTLDEYLDVDFKNILKEYIQNIVSEVDTNKDGILSIEEIDNYLDSSNNK